MNPHVSQSTAAAFGFGKSPGPVRSCPVAAAFSLAGLALLAVGGFAVGAWGADIEDSPWAVLVALVLVAGLALVGLLGAGPTGPWPERRERK